MINKTPIIIDTNIILRFLLNDHPVLSQKAARIITSASEIQLEILVIAETIWVLQSFYKMKRPLIAETLLDFVSQPIVEIDRPTIALAAIHKYGQANLSFVDCYIDALAQQSNVKLATFDLALEKTSVKKSR